MLNTCVVVGACVKTAGAVAGACVVTAGVVIGSCVVVGGCVDVWKVVTPVVGASVVVVVLVRGIVDNFLVPVPVDAGVGSKQ